MIYAYRKGKKLPKMENLIRLGLLFQVPVKDIICLQYDEKNSLEEKIQLLVE